MTAANNITRAITALLTVLAVATPLHASMVAHYQFDGDLLDESVNNLSGTAQGSQALTFVEGVHGEALALDGNFHQRVEISTSRLIASDSFTFAAWVNAHTISGNSSQYLFRIDDYDNGQDHEHGVAVRGNGRLSYTEKSSEGSNSITSATGKFLNNEWFHFAVTRQDLGEFDSVTLFVNGINVGNASFKGRDIGSAVDGTLIGGNRLHSGLTERFDGWIDELFLYDHALSEVEVNELYSSPVPSPSSAAILLTALVMLMLCTRTPVRPSQASEAIKLS
jgi:hypothetical protein